jgi:hypothetical protein
VCDKLGSLIFLRGNLKAGFQERIMGLSNTPPGSNQPKPGSGSGQKPQTPIQKVQQQIPQRVSDTLDKKK